MHYVILIIGLAAAGLVALFLFIRWGTRWGSTPEERSRRMPGDAWLEDGPAARVVMTRAISLSAPPEIVWPWLAQLGRGAGWYSVEWLDNGRKTSARHIVSWIPEPLLGDAAAIGYLRHLDPGLGLAWWVDGVRFAGATARLVVDIEVQPDGAGTRLIIRMSGDAAGAAAGFSLLVFRIIDSIMAVRQLQGIRQRVERYGARTTAPEDPETGARDQYQMYEVVYASGDSAGVKGTELATRWRRAAIDDGVLRR